jgi:hypothetical protein
VVPLVVTSAFQLPDRLSPLLRLNISSQPLICEPLVLVMVMSAWKPPPQSLLML